ncbi:MAG: hypothetical protein H7Z37_18635, partial [Pyrinomonadaceae bacterium]|nr:hypothetical protein [Pyrinomonadaceae bacterium]
ETIKNAPAVIFDMRGYPRGDTARIYTHLTDKSLAPAVFSRPYRDAKDLNISYHEEGANYSLMVRNEPAKRFQGEIYKGKIIVLINENTQSAAEGATGSFANVRPDTVFIGTPTAGANGDVTYMVLPGNIKVAFTGHNVRRYDGQQLQRVGIQPKIFIAPTIRGILEGRDEILDAAHNFLQSNAAK